MQKPEKLYPQENETVPVAQSQDPIPGSRPAQPPYPAAQSVPPRQSSAAQTARAAASTQMNTSAQKRAAHTKAQQASSGRKPKKSKQKRSGTPWLLCFIILLIIALVVVLFAGQSSAKKAANTAAAAASVAESASDITFGETASEVIAQSTAQAQTEADSSIEQMGIQPAEAAPSDEEETVVSAAPVEVTPTPTPETTVSFDDVDANSAYFSAVMWAAEIGIAPASDDNLFRPDDACTRAEAVTFLWRMAGEPTPDNMTSSFEDMADPSDPAYTAVMWAVETGITSGTGDTTFSPDATVTRAQMVTFLYRYAGSPIPAPTAVVFEDVDSESAAADAITWALGAGITSGTSDTTFSPDDACTRGQVVTFLYRYAGE